METGANQRPSKVIYDRAASSICEARVGDFDWPTIFKGAKWLHITGITLDLSKYEELSQKVLDIYPGMSTIAITLRAAVNANINGWSACMRDRKNGFLSSKKYELTDIVDRVGGGDSFASAFIAGMNLYEDRQQSLEFAVAGSALKHSVLGDFNRVNRKEVEALMGGDGSGRVQR